MPGPATCSTGGGSTIRRPHLLRCFREPTTQNMIRRVHPLDRSEIWRSVNDAIEEGLVREMDWDDDSDRATIKAAHPQVRRDKRARWLVLTEAGLSVMEGLNGLE